MRLAVLASMTGLACLIGCNGDDSGTTTTPTATAPTTATTASSSSTTVEGTDTQSETSTTSVTVSTSTGTTDGTESTDGTDSATTTGDLTATDGTSTTTTTDGTTGSTTEDTTGGGCLDELPNPAGEQAVLAADYVGTYVPYDLGPVPVEGGGVLPRLGGLVISPDDPNTMLVIGPSEVPEAELHEIGVERGPCGHIIGFVGTATKILTAPYLDLMSNGPKDIVFITHYPTKQLSQYIPGSMELLDTVDLGPLADNHSPGGLNFVPPGYADEGMLRLMGYPTGQTDPGGWYRATIDYEGDHYTVGPLTKTVDIFNGPGGFAYIPAGSPLFPKQRIMVTEWLSNPRSVSSYEVDDEGDPIPETRKLFFESFVKPWGSYFEPETGDYMFLQWEAQPDHIFIVQGFVPPPPIPG